MQIGSFGRKARGGGTERSQLLCNIFFKLSHTPTPPTQYGYGARGTSVVLLRNHELRKHMFFTYTEVSGGVIIEYLDSYHAC